MGGMSTVPAAGNVEIFKARTNKWFAWLAWAVAVVGLVVTVALLAVVVTLSLLSSKRGHQD